MDRRPVRRARRLGEKHGVDLHDRYADAFPAAYRQDTSAAAAVVDIGRMEGLGDGDDLAMHLYRPLEAAPGTLRFKLFRHGQSVTLSDVLPLLENMGVHVVDERPTRCGRPAPSRSGSTTSGCATSSHRPRHRRDARALPGLRHGLARGELENDGLNRLVLRAGLRGREVAVVRAYAKYLRQVGAGFALDYTVATLANNPALARRLFELFSVRLDPDTEGDRDLAAKHVVHDFEAASTPSPASTRTGSCAPCSGSWRRRCGPTTSRSGRTARLTVARDQARLGADPRPAPPAADVRDLRLLAPCRGCPPARRVGRPRRPALVRPAGGLPDRGARADEGADGEERRHRAGRRQGRLRRQEPAPGRDALQAEVVACYSTFIRGLLDVTDNLVAGQVVPPERVVRYDEDDAYLVVAADKGTATFSDIANAISKEYGFWLGDAFASGGSAGYDHKAMGITARGAWISVQRFRTSASTCRTRTSRSPGSGTCPATSSATGCCCRGTSAWWPPSTTGTSSSTPTPTRRPASPSAGGCSTSLFQLGGLRRVADLARGGVFPDGEDGPALPEVRARLDVGDETLTPDE